MRKPYVPSIGELEAFVACARHGTTTMAGEALNLTQSAVSRSLATLEDKLGVALFDRVKKRLILSPAGHVFLARAEALLADINDAAVGVMAFGGASGVLRMAVLPSFSRVWLIPRLAGFAKLNPSAGFDISARLLPVDFDKEPFDLAIMRKPHETAGSHLEEILPETLVVVASPTLLDGRKPVSEDDLVGLPLLQQSTRPTLWLDWFRESNIDPRRILRGARLDHFDMIMDAAIAGMGVGIVPEVIAAAALERGTLVRASPRRFATGDAYSLILPERSRDNPHVKAFRNWLLSEISAS